MNYKKLLLSIALTTLYCGIASSPAQADTLEYFTESFQGGYTINGIYDVTTNKITSAYNVNGGVTTTITNIASGGGPSGSYNGHYTSQTDFSFQFQGRQNGVSWGYTLDSRPISYKNADIFYTTSGGGQNHFAGIDAATMTNVAPAWAGGAPEIDGSLAPKVGFLLGCLFLMFGRKKQNTEALLTA